MAWPVSMAVDDVTGNGYYVVTANAVKQFLLAGEKVKRRDLDCHVNAAVLLRVRCGVQFPRSFSLQGFLRLAAQLQSPDAPA